MDKKDKKRGLGRGLSALMADVEAVSAPEAETVGSRSAERRLPIEKILPNPDQPRRMFKENQLDELTRSIEEKGVLQPLIVRAHPEKEGQFQIVAGERRWRAAQRARVHDVPVVVRDYTDTEVLEIAIIENVQRADLNPIEEAQGYQMLMDGFGHTQDKLAKALGKSRSHIANMLRLLNLPDDIQGFVTAGSVSMGHARALLTAKDPAGLVQRIVKEGLSVRDTERLARENAPARPTAPRKPSAKVEKDADTRALEGELSAHLRMPVSIAHRPDSEGGTLTLKYRDLEQLDDLCRLLSGDH